uniref:Uncharacterized protein n=1 Tax=Vitrella brassicaformis TaxID=1169539 RepID=A0A7S1K105_9ALVE
MAEFRQLIVCRCLVCECVESFEEGDFPRLLRRPCTVMASSLAGRKAAPAADVAFGYLSALRFAGRVNGDNSRCLRHHHQERGKRYVFRPSLIAQGESVEWAGVPMNESCVSNADMASFAL